jgi:peptide subunit release factor 1 (eRF1)
VVDSPFPPLPALPAVGVAPPAELLDVVATHAMKSRTIGVLLVRLGGYAAGVFDGGELVASKVGSRQVHGRSAAGGWSQQRFARRREGQVRVALDAAVSAAVLVLVPALPRLEAVVTGGDRQALRTVLDDQRLSGVRARLAPRILDVPDPKAKVLRDSYRAATAVRITITELPP